MPLNDTFYCPTFENTGFMRYAKQGTESHFLFEQMYNSETICLLQLKAEKYQQEMLIHVSAFLSFRKVKH